MFLKIFLLAIMLFLNACTLKESTIGLIGAMSEEIELVKSQMSNVKIFSLGHNTFYQGKIGNKNVVLSLSGIGSVNAAITTTLLIDHFKTKAIIFTGVSGAITNNLNVGDIVIGTNFIHYDVDHTIFGLEPGHISRETVWKYPADLKLIEFVIPIAQKLFPSQQIVKGRVVSGDNFIKNKDLRFTISKQFQADAIDMESASVAHVAYKFGIPVVIIRAMSNGTDGDDKEQYEKFFKDAAKNSAEILLQVIKSSEFPY